MTTVVAGNLGSFVEIKAPVARIPTLVAETSAEVAEILSDVRRFQRGGGTGGRGVGDWDAVEELGGLHEMAQRVVSAVVTATYRSRARGLFLILLGMGAFLVGTMAAVPVTILRDSDDPLWPYLLEEFEMNGLSRSCISGWGHGDGGWGIRAQAIE